MFPLETMERKDDVFTRAAASGAVRGEIYTTFLLDTEYCVM